MLPAIKTSLTLLSFFSFRMRREISLRNDVGWAHSTVWSFVERNRTYCWREEHSQWLIQ